MMIAFIIRRASIMMKERLTALVATFLDALGHGLPCQSALRAFPAVGLYVFTLVQYLSDNVNSCFKYVLGQTQD